MYDLIIIGGGPAGYVAAERAGHKGLSVILFEKKNMGGVCLNEGCIPSKTFLYSAKTYENAVHGDKYGVYCDNVRFDYGKIVARKNKVVRKLVAGVESKMKLNHVEVVRGEAMIQGRTSEGVEITCNGEIYLGNNLLICTGSEAFVPPIPGLGEIGDIILTNREILDLKWSQVDVERGMAFLPTSKTGCKPLYLSAATQLILANLPRIDGNPHVIAGRTSTGPRSDLKRPWDNVRRAAKILDVRLHDLRHSFASLGVGGGMGLPIIGKLLGHSQPATTARYAHLDADPMHRAANSIGDTIIAAMNGGKPENVVYIDKRR